MVEYGKVSKTLNPQQLSLPLPPKNYSSGVNDKEINSFGT